MCERNQSLITADDLDALPPLHEPAPGTPVAAGGDREVIELRVTIELRNAREHPIIPGERVPPAVYVRVEAEADPTSVATERVEVESVKELGDATHRALHVAIDKLREVRRDEACFTCRGAGELYDDRYHPHDPDAPQWTCPTCKGDQVIPAEYRTW